MTSHLPASRAWPRHLAVVFGVCVGTMVFAVTATADEWVTPQPVDVASPSGAWSAHVVPREVGTTKGNATAHVKGPSGAWDFALRSEWMPVDVVVLEDGSLVSFDQWHQLGYGDVAIAYQHDGTLLWSKTLEQLIGADAMNQASHSVSSIWWRKTPLEFTLSTDKDAPTITLTLKDENHLVVDLATGAATTVAVTSIGDDPERLMARARALATEGKLAEAREHLERLVALTPDDPIACGELADVLQQLGAHAEVVKVLSPRVATWVAAVAPGTGYNAANALVKLAQSQQMTGDGKGAEASLRLAVEQEPTYFYPVQALARVLAEAGRGDELDALMAAHMARNKGEGYYEGAAAADIGSFYRARNELEKARAYYLEGYSKDEVTNQFAYQSLAEVSATLGHKAEARAILEQLIAHWQKIGADAFKRDIDEAKRMLRELP